MNALLAAMAVANPVITALLTVLVFLEKDKIKKRSEDLEAALKAGNQELVQTVAAQKENFENIASRLEALSKDSAKSAETFVGLSTALTESSAVSATALNGVTSGLDRHAKSVEDLVTNLSNQVSTTASNAIGDLAKRSEETLQTVASQVTNLETSQSNAIGDLAKRSEETLQTVASQVTSLGTSQSGTIETLGVNSSNTLASISEQIKKVEAAQVAVANSVRELQETLKNTVSL